MVVLVHCVHHTVFKKREREREKREHNTSTDSVTCVISCSLSHVSSGALSKLAPRPTHREKDTFPNINNGFTFQQKKKQANSIKRMPETIAFYKLNI